ncbi:MAG TPA: hypothetical protein VKR27_01200, partial [Acidimicrobiales bacterium]|nr:hypothetical protein [Acidimicrobiales bacterium]
APASGEAYNVASGIPVPLGELVQTMIDLTGRDVDARFTGAVRPGDPLHWRGNPARAAALGVVATTTLREGLHLTMDWFRDVQPSAATREVQKA